VLQLLLQERQLIGLQPFNLVVDRLVEFKTLNELVALVCLSNQLGNLRIVILYLLSNVYVFAHCHGQVAHLGQRLEVAEEVEVGLDVLVRSHLSGYVTAIGVGAATHPLHHRLDGVLVELGVVDLPDVLLQVVCILEVNLSLAEISSFLVSSHELGERIKQEDDYGVVLVLRRERLDLGEVLLVDVLHLLGLGLTQILLHLSYISKLISIRLVLLLQGLDFLLKPNNLLLTLNLPPGYLKMLLLLAVTLADLSFMLTMLSVISFMINVIFYSSFVSS